MSIPRKFPEFSDSENTRKLLEYLVYHPNELLTPEIHGSHKISYPLAEKITELPINKYLIIIKELVMAKWLIASPYSNVTACPKCSSFNLSTHYTCIYCGEAKLTQNPTIVHLKCGYVGFVSDFEEMHELVCPNCHEKLTIKKISEEWIAPGMWYYCNNCKKFSRKAKLIFTCLSCGHVFGIDQSKLVSIYSYSLNPAAFNVVTEYVGAFQDLIIKLASEGYQVEYPASIQANAPMPHSFTFRIAYNNIDTIIDVLYSPKGHISEEDVMAFVAKASEIDIPYKLIIAIPDATEKAIDIAESFKIDLLIAPDLNVAKTRIYEYLNNLKQRFSKEFQEQESAILKGLLSKFSLKP
ncbi:MAG: hypothetical protein ACP6IU_01200 [Candidatus Asgardarchaeia archaeon]